MNHLDLTPHIWIDKVFGTMNYGYKEVIKQRLNLPNDTHIEYIRADIVEEREEKLVRLVIEKWYKGNSPDVNAIDKVYELAGLEKLK